MASKTLSLAGAGAIGFGLAYFFDPNSGAQRRSVFLDKLNSQARTGAGTVTGVAKSVGAKAGGTVASIKSEETMPPNDETLKAKVESEVLGQPDVPKDRISIDVSDGIVALRGEVENREIMQAVDAKVREVTGVREIQNLLHLPGEQPPNLSPVSGTTG